MNDYDMARQLVQVFLKAEQKIPTREIIQERVKAVLSMLTSQQGRAVEIDEEKLIREIQTLVNIQMGIGTILDSEKGHVPWLSDRNSEINWDFWNRYVRYLEEEKGWAPATITGLDRLTNDVLERLEDPQRPGAWDRRGMVVGQVQSGKTANYTGLVCKAVDAGYKVIIVLAGLTDSLRSQTQIRLDEGFLGFDSRVYRAFDEKKNSFVGAGTIAIGKPLIAHSATSSDQKGDFNRKVANQFGVLPGGQDPLVLVVKKNKSVLNNLFNWALSSVRGIVDEESGRRIVRGVPLLVIDDEADNGSIDTNPLVFDDDDNIIEDHDPTKINALIRKLLYSFEQSAYVAYTATPFANIFIHEEARTNQCGDDLFPRSFIINLPTPSNYVGPARVFGLEADAQSGLEASEGLPIVRLVKDHEKWMPTAHKKEHVPGEIPESLYKAIKSFILSCAVRIARGQEKAHNSMLVHVTLLTSVQERVAVQVQDVLTSIQRRLRYGDGNAPKQLRDEFRQLWESDFLPTSESMMHEYAIQTVCWEEADLLLNQAASKIQIKKINGTAKDVLDYSEHKNGLSVIAIGGNKLSRGLTLEDLTVSYYLRPTRMYDSLMQMGRWFGYRPGYLDLCRLYTTDELVQWYKHITVASEELRQELDYMAAEDATPEDFGLKVRTHPQGLMITAANKMRSGTTMQLSYTRSLSETTIFYKNDEINEQNFKATDELLKTLGKYEEKSKNYLWREVSADKVIDFLSAYQSHHDCRPANTTLLVQYIKAQLPRKELVSWTVVLISNEQAKKDRNTYVIGGHEVGLTERKDSSSESPHEYRMSKSHLLSPTDEWLDLSAETQEEILELTQQKREKAGKPPMKSKTPDGKIIREKRDKRNGLLLLYPLDSKKIKSITSPVPIVGFVMSFPKSTSDIPIEYRVNNTRWKEDAGLL
ncbi:Z1 domain-containing protein [Oscillatoria sp. FACHB-1407]|uniref:Z1 domain-containing protein n=1 Tax=Oscillatoria sp. FACHB-1407 TaxID=2692847 RepID=UPI001687D1C0|nr:Z1 domain-containing protein [Oscillatoria sp. FACHB-1407]MBD2465606.1 Z1 domain-containing protein [Oscillatoria sp. FACHB-1407]